MTCIIEHHPNCLLRSQKVTQDWVFTPVPSCSNWLFFLSCLSPVMNCEIGKFQPLSDLSCFGGPLCLEICRGSTSSKGYQKSHQKRKCLAGRKGISRGRKSQPGVSSSQGLSAKDILRHIVSIFLFSMSSMCVFIRTNVFSLSYPNWQCIQMLVCMRNSLDLTVLLIKMNINSSAREDSQDTKCLAT